MNSSFSIRSLLILPWFVGLALACSIQGATVPSEKAAVARAILSREGSGRATAYADQFKIITVQEKTHVVWLDADESGFHVRGRTLDRSTGQWSESVTIGEAQDNHGGPSLTVDSEGYLHVVYYPHHQPVRYRRSLRPNDLADWGPEIQFGEGLSYPMMICGRDNTLVLTARRGYFDTAGDYVDSERIEQELWIKRPGADWTRKATLLRSRYPRYAQFATALAWDPDGRTIHLSSRIYESGANLGLGDAVNRAGPEAKPLTTVAYMKSPDGGETWTTATGTRIDLPATAETVDVLAQSDGADGVLLNAGPLAVSPTGVPYLVYTAKFQGRSRLYLATPAPGLGWSRRDLTNTFPEEVRQWEAELGMGGGLTFSESGRATIVAVVLNPTAEERGTLKEWGHPSTEILRLYSDDEFGTTHAEILKPVDAQEPHWLVNIERATGHNRVPPEPGIIFTAGVAGGGLKDLKLENRVLWQPRN